MPPVILDQIHWAQLEQVQAQVERKVAYSSDMQRFGVEDWWEPAVDKGDCEDMVLAKRQKLMDMGWPADTLRIAVVIDGHGELHAVLTVDVVSQKGAPATYVLDSHFQHVEPWNLLGQYGYTWLERSKPGSTAWSRLDNGSPSETMRIANLASQVMPASPRWADTQTAYAAATVEVKAQVGLIKAAEQVEGVRAAPAVLNRLETPALLIKASARDEDQSEVRAASAAEARHHHRASRHHGRAHGRHGRRSA